MNRMIAFLNYIHKLIYSHDNLSIIMAVILMYSGIFPLGALPHMVVESDIIT